MPEPIQDQDSLVLRLDPGLPIELNNLTDSFSALARMYERNYRAQGQSAPKLFVTRLESGSIIAEITPFLVMFGAIISTMETSVVVADFTNRLVRAIRVFADFPAAPSRGDQLPPREDISDVREFLRVITGRRGARLGLTHARIESTDGRKRTVAEFDFDEAELNRAAINIDEALASQTSAVLPVEAKETYLKEVMLFFQQASRGPGREQGRTADKAVVPAVSQKPLPVYFRKSFQDLKDRMIRGEINPLNSAFVVDVSVEYFGTEARAYIVTEVHDVVAMDTTDELPFSIGIGGPGSSSLTGPDEDT